MIVAVSAAGCPKPPGPAPPPPGAAPGIAIEISAEPVDLDLLVLVDDESSMREEQALLIASMGTLITLVTSPPDEDRDGAPDWQAVPTLHVGVLSGDMGAAGYPVAACDDP